LLQITSQLATANQLELAVCLNRLESNWLFNIHLSLLHTWSVWSNLNLIFDFFCQCWPLSSIWKVWVVGSHVAEVEDNGT